MKEKISEVVFDIETLPLSAGETDHGDRDGPGEDPAEILRRASLAPLTARTLTVAMLNPATLRGMVWYEHPQGDLSQSPDGQIEVIPATEEVMLRGFWAAVTRFRRVITFNGRLFDCPFLMLRSALLGIRPSRNLIPYRFSAREHCDLLDQLTFYGAMRKFTLESYCRGFGIDSPGSEGQRPDFARLVAEGRYREIAEYAAGTVTATARLYRCWENLLSPCREP